MKFHARERIVLGALAVAAISAILVFAFTPGGRTTVIRQCPTCFGFVQAGRETFAEKPATGIAVGLRSIAQARVALWYGPPETYPMLFVCADDACPRKFNPDHGGAIGFTVRTDTIVLTAQGTNPAIMAHEWSHAELKHRLGLWNFVRAEVPPWFDEGLAVVVGQDQRYLTPDVAQKYCPPGFRTDELEKWKPNAGNRMTYATVACVVNHWLETHGGKAGLQKLIAGIRQGESFAQAFRAG